MILKIKHLSECVAQEADDDVVIRYQRVLACTCWPTSQGKTRQHQRGNSRSECDSGSRFELRIDSPNDPLYHSAQCADKAS